MLSAQKISSLYKNISAQKPYATPHQLDKYDTDMADAGKNNVNFKDVLKKEISKIESSAFAKTK